MHGIGRDSEGNRQIAPRWTLKYGDRHYGEPMQQMIEPQRM